MQIKCRTRILVAGFMFIALACCGGDKPFASTPEGVSGIDGLRVAPQPVYIQIQLHIEPFGNNDPDSRFLDESVNVRRFINALEAHGAKASLLPSHHFAQKAFDTKDPVLNDSVRRGHEVGVHTHMVKADGDSKWGWSLVPFPEIPAWLNSDGYYRAVSRLKEMLGILAGRITHITGWSQDDAQKARLFDLTERLGFATSSGGYAFKNYDYPHYAYHPKDGIDYYDESTDGSVHQLYIHHMGPAIEEQRLFPVEDDCAKDPAHVTVMCDFLNTLDMAAATPGKVFVHGFSIHNNALFLPGGGANAENYKRLNDILSFYDAYVQDGRAAYSTFRDVYQLHLAAEH